MPPSKTIPHVAIIVLNYKEPEATIACVNSLQTMATANTHIVVVDNDSQDGSAQQLKQALTDITLLEAPSNNGYSSGNNIGINHALVTWPECDFIWLLNNDTTVKPNTLEALLETAREYPNTLIGGHILNPDQSFQQVGTYVLPWRGQVKFYANPIPNMQVESLSGCSMLIPRHIIDTVGLLSEDYFLYFEDNDYCLRAAKAGFPCVVSLNAHVIHADGLSTKKNKPLVTYYYQRNRMMFMRQRSWFQGFLATWYTQIVRQLRSAVKSWYRKEERPHYRALQLALHDFHKGIVGKCAHNI